ncbi:BamA/TamA family outer membrane protein, partial [Bacteroidales bacterium OttesenSCG-928-I21]|nr:BamA/TamA family outer membrane protein [Bacteroidales bacterium OttesenSCG-928-I21]
SRSFGLIRFKLGIYNISGRDSTKKINRFFRKIGDTPVLYNEYLTERSDVEMRRYLQNKGYVNAAVNHDVKFKKKKAAVTYTVEGNRPYRIGNFVYRIRDEHISDLIKKDSANSLIHKNMLFDTDVLDNERIRITNLLKQHGYYNFNKDYLHYLADSTHTNHTVNVRMILRPATKTDAEGNVVVTEQKQYKIGRIRFFTSYDPISEFNISSLDSVVYGQYVVYFDEKMNLRPDILVENCHIESGALYNEQQVDKTYSALTLLSAVKYVNIRFREVEQDSANISTLDCMIFTSPAKQQSYSIDVEGTNSSGDFGFAGILGYQHKNLFKGSESFKISLRLAHETQTGSISDLLKYNSNEIGVDASLTFSKFLFPFLSFDFRRKVRASTEFNTNVNYQKRPEYSRTIASVATRYHWSQNKRLYHTVDLIDFNYVYLPYISDAFREKYLDTNSILKYSYENQLIVFAGYSISYRDRAFSRLKDNIAARFGIESAGNLLQGISGLFDFKKIDDSYVIGKIKFAQYIKADLSFSYDKYIDRRNNIVYHLGFGIGVPYGNTNILPFEKRYFSGGANSVRGWSVRTLGPGSYKGSRNQIDYMNQSGDIKLDMNLEYRFKMFWLLEGAFFADAGNIWTIDYYDTQEGGQFKFNEFMKQIALGYGLGFRFDFTYFIVRIDMGVKAYNPALNGSEKWRFRGLNWNDDFAFHFAVGYPF